MAPLVSPAVHINTPDISYTKGEGRREEGGGGRDGEKSEGEGGGGEGGSEEDVLNAAEEDEAVVAAKASSLRSSAFRFYVSKPLHGQDSPYNTPKPRDSNSSTGNPGAMGNDAILH